MSLTLTQGITRVLKRTRLSTSNEDNRDAARDYLSLSLSEVVHSGPKWVFLDQTGTFTVTSGTRKYTPVAGNVTWQNFVDQTNGRTLDIISSNEYDSIDPEHDDSGTIEKVYVSGIDATDKEPSIYLWRTPSNSTTVIRYRGELDIAGWSSANDASTFLALGIPRIIEKTIIHGATAMYLEEKGDYEAAGIESQRHVRSYNASVSSNSAQQGNRQYLPIRNRSGEDFTINISTGQVTAA